MWLTPPLLTVDSKSGTLLMSQAEVIHLNASPPNVPLAKEHLESSSFNCSYNFGTFELFFLRV
jgi:hypothetical protein